MGGENFSRLAREIRKFSWECGGAEREGKMGTRRRDLKRSRDVVLTAKGGRKREGREKQRPHNVPTPHYLFNHRDNIV